VTTPSAWLGKPWRRQACPERRAR